MKPSSIPLPPASSLLKKLSFLGSSNSLAQLMMAIYTLLLARVMGVDNYGFFAGSYSLAVLSSFVVNWGMDICLMRETSQPDAQRDLLPVVLRIKILFGLVWGAALVWLPPLLYPQLYTPGMMLVCVVDIFSESITNSFLVTLTAQKRVRLYARTILISRGLKLLGAVILVALGLKAPLAYALLRMAATLAALTAVTLMSRLPLRTTEKTLPPLQFWRSSIPYGLSELLALVYGQADITLLSVLAGKAAAGIYAPASSLVNALFVIPNAVYLVFLPYLVELFGSRNVEQLRKYLGWMIGIQFAVGVILALGVGLAGRPLLGLLLQKDFSATGRILVILSLLLVFKSISFGFAAWLIAIGWQRYRVIPQAVVALGSIVLDLWIIPLYGVSGAAWVYVAGEFLLMLGYGILAIRGWSIIKQQGTA